MTRATRLARRKPRRRASAGDASFDSGPDRDGLQPIIAARPPEILRLHAFLEHPPGYHFPWVAAHGRRAPLAEVRSGRPRVAVAPKHISHQLCPVPSDRDGLQGPPRRLPMANFRIENVVASTSLGRELDLKAIALALGGSEYEPEQFPGLIYRIKEPKTAILLFRSGKVVCTGAKSLENVKTAIDLVAKQIEAAGISIKKNPEIEVQNIVATSDLGAPLDLNAVAITLRPGAVEYEPAQFPRLVYRIDEPKVVLLMFGSGKGVCTGARKPADVEKAAEKITAELKANGLLH